jgi:SAM-dependent methyltransferase
MDQKIYWERPELSGRRHPANPAIREYVLPTIKVISDFIRLQPSVKLLDVGCGNGFFTFYFDKVCDTCGVDFSEKMLALNPVEKKMLMDAKDLKFKDDSFDVVFCHALLHHVEDIDRVVSEMKRVSRKYVVILEPNILNPLMFLFSIIKKEERGALRFSLSFLRKLIERNGLSMLASFSYGLIVPNKTPLFLLPVMRWFNFKQPFGMTNFLITQK